jgi:hypothetical protein
LRSVAALVEKPNPLAVVDSNERRHLGCPVFGPDGRVCGIAATVRPPQKPHEFFTNFENHEPDIVVRPATDVVASLTALEKAVPK